MTLEFSFYKGVYFMLFRSQSQRLRPLSFQLAKYFCLAKTFQRLLCSVQLKITGVWNSKCHCLPICLTEQTSTSLFNRTRSTMNGSAKFKSVPIIDISKENVATVAPVVRGAIIGADFIAIDCVS